MAFFTKHLSVSEFPDLQHLKIHGLSCFKEISLLVEKTKGNISQIYIYTTNKAAKNTGMLIKAIANNCPKIERLSTYIKPKDFIHVKSLLLNCRSLTFIRFDGLKFFVESPSAMQMNVQIMNGVPQEALPAGGRSLSEYYPP